MTWIIRDSDEPKFTRESQELQDQLKLERVALKAEVEQSRAQRFANGTEFRRTSASGPSRILCRTVVTKRAATGEIEEFERYETPIKRATRSGHQWSLPNPVIE